MLDLAYPVENVQPAAYNPREIAPDAIDALKASIQAIGFCKPIIVGPGGLIIAGHQRTKAAKALGLVTVPAFVITAPVSTEDEVAFNQLHNGTDLDRINIPVYIRRRGGSVGPFEYCAPDTVEIDGLAQGAIIRQHLATLVLRFGPFGVSVVDDRDGLVIGGPHYALVCRQLGLPVRVYRLDGERADLARQAFARQYGDYSYSHLAKAPHIQSLAQPNREDTLAPVISESYRNWILPVLEKGGRVLDFGCGKSAPIRALQARGYRIQGIEFFPRPKGRDAIDTKGAHMMIDGALDDLRRYGLFDAVICDYVVNSVQSLEAEADVVHCVNAFCKPGGLMAVSGRSLENAEQLGRVKQWQSVTNPEPKQFFVDKDGFGARLMKGEWFFQRYHRRAEVERYGEVYGYDQAFNVRFRGGSYWFTAGLKTRDLDPVRTEAAVRREFDLAWPSGQTVGRADAAVEAWTIAREKTSL